MLRILIASTLLLSACRDSAANFPDALVEEIDAAEIDAGEADSAVGEMDATTAAGDAASAMDASGQRDAVVGGIDAVVGATDATVRPDASSGTGLEPGPGDLLIVEIQGNPQTAADNEAEYIEVLNVSARALDLEGCRLTHREWAGGAAPAMSVGNHRVNRSVPIAPGARVTLVRSNGGYFGTATRDYVYSGFELGNGASDNNRVRIMAPGWDGTEPPDPSHVVDELIAPAGTFENNLRGRAWQLEATATSNDDPMDWCHAASSGALAYWNMNWGTPGAENVCP